MTSPPLLRLLVRPFEAFFRTEALGGTVLMLSTIVALIWANSPWAASYDALWNTKITIGAEGFGLSKALILWVNDGLMAIFFFVVGLEIKRELLVGELSSPKKALLPVVAAIGGMVVPALLYVAIARKPPESAGWGIPMATDIAFALGCMRLLGARVPAMLVVFLTALAIIDDLGAIVVIAMFYTDSLSMGALGVAGGCIAALIALNVLGVRNAMFYVLIGLPLWVAILKSGVHATIGGVILGLMIPARALFSKREVLDQARELVAMAEQGNEEETAVALEALENRLDEVESPLARLEHALHPWVAFVIIPIFALANAGVSFSGIALADLGQPAALGVLVGLFAGKQIGVFGATFAAVKLGLGELPSGITWRQIYGLAALAGIGFTMSFFVAGLAYEPGAVQHVQAKLGILAASVLSAVAGLLILAKKPAQA